MSSFVLNINADISIEELDEILASGIYRYIHIDHSSLTVNQENIINLARKNLDIWRKLVSLTNHGFFTYVLREGVSSFVNISELQKLWIPLKEKKYSISDKGIVYEYVNSEHNIDKKMLVIFSQIPLDPHSSSLNRYFSRSFSTLEKYVGKNVSILRIADIGGITGAFYLNTIGLPNNENNIQSLIKNIASNNNIDEENIVLYGASKGGTAAMYHGLSCKFKVVAVDPIFDDEFYLSEHNDLHMINGIFPDTKKNKFSMLLNDKINELPDIKVITSKNSEQFPYIENFLRPIIPYITLLNCINPMIKKHPDVGPYTIHATTALINASLINLPMTPNYQVFL
ncbi:XcbB/CpsF family capsular polysaccharide biosynthesis protein [Rahnella sp. FC061912-K]|uniref:XcbB/CpsF family capsular polysaccharide biosynthesis protein n=1 Tax=Rahnella rivi TaxID=2816249 RepID=UPI001C252A9F|nr:XcbB/CpsF family capsular polysaccharide biosynthesis protein [Rahnella rivi]MBU9829620.1 XcbB/CpsF family capsular polysaccharide biosynthesis protein [Rahnella rivi]